MSMYNDIMSQIMSSDDPEKLCELLDDIISCEEDYDVIEVNYAIETVSDKLKSMGYDLITLEFTLDLDENE